MTFLSNPDLVTFNPEWPGNPIEGKRFREYAGTIDTGLNKVARYVMRPNPQASEKRNDEFRPVSFRQNLSQPGDWVCWLGHASFLIQLDGTRYLTDPVFHRLGLLKRRVGVPYSIAELGPIDYVLLSHDHRDHCDERTLKELSAEHDFTVLSTLRMGNLISPWLRRNQSVQEAGWYQRYNTPTAQPIVSLLPTQHWCRRYLHDMNRCLWGSFVLEGKRNTIWFGGDSGYSPHFAEVRTYFPRVDLALIGIGAYKPAWFMQAAHTSPEQAWRGFEDTGARRLMPMHYGTYDLSQEPAGEPLRLIEACAKTAGREGDLVVSGVGEVVRLAG